MPDLRHSLASAEDQCRLLDPLFTIQPFVPILLDPQYEKKADRSGKRPPALTLAEKKTRRIEQNRIHRRNADKRNENHQKNVRSEFDHLNVSIASCHAFLTKNHPKEPDDESMMIDFSDLEVVDFDESVPNSLGDVNNMINDVINIQNESGSANDTIEERICALYKIIYDAPDAL